MTSWCFEATQDNQKNTHTQKKTKHNPKTQEQNMRVYLS